MSNIVIKRMLEKALNIIIVYNPYECQGTHEDYTSVFKPEDHEILRFGSKVHHKGKSETFQSYNCNSPAEAKAESLILIAEDKGTEEHVKLAQANLEEIRKKVII